MCLDWDGRFGVPRGGARTPDSDRVRPKRSASVPKAQEDRPASAVPTLPRNPGPGPDCWTGLPDPQTDSEVDINTPNPKHFNWTALHYAANADDPGLVGYLIQRKADIGHQATDGSLHHFHP